MPPPTAPAPALRAGVMKRVSTERDRERDRESEEGLQLQRLQP
jgi:hypothetical protein